MSDIVGDLAITAVDSRVCTYYVLDFDDKYVSFARWSLKDPSEPIIPAVFLIQVIMNDLGRPLDEAAMTKISKKALTYPSCERMSTPDFKRVVRFRKRILKETKPTPVWAGRLVLCNFRQPGAPHCLISVPDCLSLIVEECQVPRDQLPQSMLTDDFQSLFITGEVFHGVLSAEERAPNAGLQSPARLKAASKRPAATAQLDSEPVAVRGVQSAASHEAEAVAIPEVEHTASPEGVLDDTPASKPIPGMRSKKSKPSTEVTAITSNKSDSDVLEPDTSRTLSKLIIDIFSSLIPSVSLGGNKFDFLNSNVDTFHGALDELSLRLRLCRELFQHAVDVRNLLQQVRDIEHQSVSLLSEVSRMSRVTQLLNDLVVASQTPSLPELANAGITGRVHEHFSTPKFTSEVASINCTDKVLEPHLTPTSSSSILASTGLNKALSNLSATPIPLSCGSASIGVNDSNLELPALPMLSCDMLSAGSNNTVAECSAHITTLLADNGQKKKRKKSKQSGVK